MHYLLAIMYDPTAAPDGSPNRVAEHQKLESEMRAAGHYRSGGGLAPVEMFAKTVVHDGRQAVTSDGPLTGSNVALGGYFVVECSEAEALAYAERISVDNRSHVQVRQAFVYRG